ncbi:kinase-like protein [Xylariaceae sp. FL1019]|nr:kinase-like protein [Xylariaceae sp. FL1019]
MELIPYSSRDEGQIVLRHRDALVVRDPASQRLQVRAATPTECPTCNRPLRPSSPESHYDVPPRHDSWVDPQYFRMLQDGHQDQDDHTEYGHRSPPSSPVRRLTQPTLPSVAVEADDDAEFVTSAPAPQEGARIRRDAFSPNYFDTFFVEERELGRGGKGVVLLVRHEIDGCALGHFACKRVPVGDDHAWLEKVLVEVKILANLSHPNLVSYRHVWLEDVQIHRFGPSVACAFILQQYCNGGDLLRYIVGDQPQQATKEQLKAQLRRQSKGQGERPSGLAPTQRLLTLEEIYSLFKDVTSGLVSLHGASYIHRDLKPSNCLLHHENGKVTCLISDFGEVQPSNAARNSSGTTGTISYCAPEVLKMDSRGQFGNFTVKSDVFSLGMILYFLCFGRLPYHNANVVQEELEDIDQLRAEIASWKGFQDERRLRPDLPPRLYQLLKKMLALHPAERPNASEVLGILNHESAHGGLRSASRTTSPSINIPNRRIQNLDSPMPPSTPQSESVIPPDEHTTQRSIPVPFLAPSPQPTSSNSLQKYQSPSSPRHRSQAMVLSRSQDQLPSPTRNHLSRSPNRNPSPTSQTPLLMPPPTTTLGVIRHQAFLFQHRVTQLYRTYSAPTSFLLRFALFLIKAASLTRVCWPYMVTLSVSTPLLAAAGLDLALSSGGSRATENHGHRRHSPQSPTGWRWDWKASLALLVLHFAALLVTSRWGSLCANNRDGWVDSTSHTPG